MFAYLSIISTALVGTVLVLCMIMLSAQACMIIKLIIISIAQVKSKRL